MSWTNLKAAIAAAIKMNNNQEITGAVLQNTLNSIVNSVGANATFAGVATPATNPGIPDGPVFYIASENGVYSNFGGITLTDEVAILSNSNGPWIKSDTGISTKENVDFISDSIIASTSLFVSSNYKIANPSDIANFTSNHILSADGTETELNGWSIYYIKNDIAPEHEPLYVSHDFGNAGFDKVFLAFALYDEQNRFVSGGIVSGEKVLRVLKGYTIKISSRTNPIKKPQYGLEITNYVTDKLNSIDERIKLNSDSIIASTSLFVSSNYKIANPSDIANFTSNHILSADGTETELNGWSIYYIKNDIAPEHEPLYVSHDFGNAGFDKVFLAFALYDEQNRFVSGGIVSGEKVLRVLKGYTIKISSRTNPIKKPQYGLEITNLQNNINPWDGKCIAFYGDSVTYIGQGTGTSMGHASSPYATDWGYNWQLYIAKYLGLKEFYSRGVGSATYEYQDWVQYAHTETGYSGDRPYPFVNFDSAEEREGWTKTHGYLAAWDRIKAQFPASIKDSIDAIFITDSNSAVNHTSDDFETPAFINGATKDADWAADSVYNVFSGDYDITTFAGAICSMIMKLQVWMPNAQIIIGSQISGRGDERGINFTKLDEARRGMYCAEKTRKIAGMMSIPYVPVFESMSVNPLNRNGKISDIVHPFTKAGGFRVGKTIAQYLMNFTPSEPPV